MQQWGGLWRWTCRNEAEAQRLYHTLKDRGVLVARSGRKLAGLASERDAAFRIIAEATGESKTQ
jgi:hypothetical protein